MAIFAARFNRAARDALPADGSVLPTDVESKNAEAMLEAGFSLIYASCMDYFRSAGKRQQWIIVANDTVAVAGTLATSILALTHAGTAAVSATALGTSTFVAGTGVYTKDFLFAAENIDSVRTLTMNALVTHQNKVRKDRGVLTVNAALVALFDDQDICTIPEITSLVRQALQTARPRATDNAGNSIGQNPEPGVNGQTPPIPGAKPTVTLSVSAADRNIVNQIVKRLGAGSGDKQVVALYWLLQKQPTQQEVDGPICDALWGTPKRLGILDRGGDSANRKCTFHTDWPDKASVTQEFKALSAAAFGSLDDAVNKLKAAGTTPETGGTTPGAAPSKHINIGVF
ncbi:hypothetical protein HDG34_005645 [Paraburkholderia sp. HC6.4b]|uniref:hypothetical protein n=1 Tax=unclassified Paraburkholderia TaxID=2615204 RepID=UPI00161B8159|nr:MULTISPECIES: hypothetical protein [unclassified Paraburkholderia]MBB5411684.1 hypothetical protein [Paraburkholderia sp. HC6.4b]MBB5453287.1 hypothetical protein [Paraburkholderia sp. Kb1A]